MEKTSTPGLVELELTSRCNLRCRHCYQHAITDRGPDLETDRILEISRSLASGGCTSVTLSGGEPTLREDWSEIASSIVGQGLTVNMVTNGQTFDDDTAQQASRCGIDTILLSLDGMEPTHDLIRWRRGAFDAALDAADAIHGAGLKLGIMTTVLGPNVDDLPSLARVVGQLAPSVWQVWLGIPHDSSDLWLKPGRVPALIETLVELRRDHPYLIAGDNVRCLPGAEPLAPRGWAGVKFGCESGREVMGIRSDGAVRGCLALPSSAEPLVDLSGGVSEAVSRLRLQRRDREIQIRKQCRGCRYSAACARGCHATALSVMGRNHCMERYRASQALGRRAAAAAASTLLATSLAAGCGPRPVDSNTSGDQVMALEPVADSITADAAPDPIVTDTATSDPMMDSDPEEIGSIVFDPFSVGCECVSEEKDDQGQPVDVQPCMCVSHMMCTATTGIWMCPPDYEQKKK